MQPTAADPESTRERIHARLDVLDAGTFEVDLASGAVTGDRRLFELLALDPDTERLSAAWDRHLHAYDRIGVATALRTCARSGGDGAVTFRVLHPGETRQVH